MTSTANPFRAALILGALLAFGLIAGAAILGYNARLAASQRQSITVKGLAEKPVKADRAELGMNHSATGKTPADALRNLRAQRPLLDTFFKDQGFVSAQIQDTGENFFPVFKRNEKGMFTEEVEHYKAVQGFTLRSEAVGQIEKTERATLSLRENGLQMDVRDPQYLVSTLEDVKMSLIGSATENAYARATEFARNGKATVGQMKSASQGAFYILPATGRADSDSDYGGVYDKSTIDKIARVVVTIEYGIQP